jgi:general secretion pathway protein G
MLMSSQGNAGMSSFAEPADRAGSHAGPEVRGITLVELLIVMAIIGVIAAIAIPGYQSYREKARVRLAITEISGINVNIRHYITNNRTLPPNLTAVGAGTTLDPWGQPYVYVDLLAGGTPRKNKSLHPLNSEFDLYSKGKDGLTAIPLTAKASRDDVIVANDGRFIGLGSDYE